MAHIGGKHGAPDGSLAVSAGRVGGADGLETIRSSVGGPAMRGHIEFLENGAAGLGFRSRRGGLGGRRGLSLLRAFLLVAAGAPGQNRERQNHGESFHSAPSPKN